MAYAGEKEILEVLKKEDSKLTIETISKLTKLNIDTIRRAIESLRGQDFIKVIKKTEEKYSPTKEFENYYETKKMPEYEVYLIAKNNGKLSNLSPKLKAIGLSWAIKKQMVKIDSGNLKPLMNEKSAKEINDELIDWNEPEFEELSKRKLIEKKVKTSYEISITKKGIAALKSGIKESKFNVGIETQNARIGKTHPLSRAMMRIKEIFVEMGFEEMDGEYVEQTFWNFDALFQPQDHPARELADTFYVDKSFKSPNKKTMDQVKKSHEKGWGYKWQESEANKGILRTHTTCLSARYLHALKDPYKKYFSVARVFRNEATDFKHLSEFSQVEGIVAWEGATFRDLLGILKVFYSKLGFDKIRFRPSYFPYTEPSVEVEVYYETRKEWMELGGAGIFRPEVTKPLDGIYPVLAWGLSLERPLMLNLGIDDIRTFYKNDLDWLKNTKISTNL